MNESPASSPLLVAHSHRRGHLAVFTVVAMLLAGCAASAPPAAPQWGVDLTSPYRQADDPSQAGGLAVDADWWQGFNDPVFTALVTRSQAENLDVRVALERVKQARAGLDATGSRLWPSVSLTGSASDQRTGLPEGVKRGSPDTHALRGAVELNWELDLFGAARAGADAAEADALASEAGVAAAQLLATTEVARLYLIWQGARARAATLQALLQAQADTERLTRSREAAGLANRFDVSRAAAETQALAAQLPPLHTLAAVTEHQLAVLLGTSPSLPVFAQATAPSSAFAKPPVLTLGQPADLLWRRPDLQAAMRQWQAESARVREAEADRWPRLFLAAVLGQQDLRLNALNLSPVRYSNVALAFTAPLFNAGRLRAALQRQDARERSAWLQLERTVLMALQDVENSLALLRGERERNAALRANTEQRRVGLRHAQSLFQEGQIDLLQLLDAQRGLLAAELAAIDSQTQIALGTVQLIKAVGGGWAPPAPRAEPLVCTAPC